MENISQDIEITQKEKILLDLKELRKELEHPGSWSNYKYLVCIINELEEELNGCS